MTRAALIKRRTKLPSIVTLQAQIKKLRAKLKTATMPENVRGGLEALDNLLNRYQCVCKGDKFEPCIKCRLVGVAKAFRSSGPA